MSTAEDDGIPIRTRRRAGPRGQTALIAAIGGGVALTILVVVIALAVGRGQRSRLPEGPMDPLGVRPRPDVEGMEWEMRQLVAYWNRCGIEVEAKSEGPLSHTVRFRGAKSGMNVREFSHASVARDAARAAPGSFAWGIWHFDGGPGELRARVADSLGVPYP